MAKFMHCDGVRRAYGITTGSLVHINGEGECIAGCAIGGNINLCGGHKILLYCAHGQRSVGFQHILAVILVHVPGNSGINNGHGSHHEAENQYGYNQLN